MIKHGILAIFIIFLACNRNFGQPDTTLFNPDEKAVKGFKFVPLPVVGYNVDIGFQYGLIVNFFNFGDGSLYPDYKYSIYTELSRTTRGSGVNQLFFDSKYLVPANIRLTADLSYLTELTLNFYGFNGYDAVYVPEFTDDNSPRYQSRVFYNQQRKFLRFTSDLQGSTGIQNLNWLGGIGYFDIRMSRVDIQRLNKGKSDAERLPDTALLIDKYQAWGIIHEDEIEGGIIPSIKTGLIFDTRDNEPNPMKGIWTEALLFIVPKIAGNNQYSYAKFAFTHRQYFTLMKHRMNLACRLGYQATVAGKTPYFMQPYMITSFAKVTTTDGLGGAKSLRGILRNRVVGNAMAFANIEARYKFWHARVLGNNLYCAVNVFADAGQVTDKIELPSDLEEKLGADEIFSDYFNPSSEALHLTAGGGLQLVFDQNTVVNLEYGRAFDPRNGRGGLYVGIGYLF